MFFSSPRTSLCRPEAWTSAEERGLGYGMLNWSQALEPRKVIVMERYTAVFERGEDGWWVASCLEMPEAITQGETIEEARENLKDAIQLLLGVRREDAEKELEGREVIRETLIL
jgi:predicted RNase H-like HicB family nuclease